PADPVSVLAVEMAVAAGLERDAEIAQFGLVPLEHPLEGLVGALRTVRGLVAGHRVADAFRGEELAGRQQANDQIDQSLRPSGRHVLETNAPAPPARGNARSGRTGAHVFGSFQMGR